MVVPRPPGPKRRGCAADDDDDDDGGDGSMSILSEFKNDSSSASSSEPDTCKSEKPSSPVSSASRRRSRMRSTWATTSVAENMLCAPEAADSGLGRAIDGGDDTAVAKDTDDVPGAVEGTRLELRVAGYHSDGITGTGAVPENTDSCLAMGARVVARFKVETAANGEIATAGQSAETGTDSSTRAMASERWWSHVWNQKRKC